jgi:hypothetical protein
LTMPKVISCSELGRECLREGEKRACMDSIVYHRKGEIP